MAENSAVQSSQGVEWTSLVRACQLRWFQPASSSSVMQEEVIGSPQLSTDGAQRHPPDLAVDGQGEQDPALPASAALVPGQADQVDRNEVGDHEIHPLTGGLGVLAASLPAR